MPVVISMGDVHKPFCIALNLWLQVAKLSAMFTAVPRGHRRLGLQWQGLLKTHFLPAESSGM